MYPAIEDQDEQQIADTFVQVTIRIGQLGREAREAIEAKLKDNRDPDIEEGLAQISDFVG